MLPECSCRWSRAGPPSVPQGTCRPGRSSTFRHPCSSPTWASCPSWHRSAGNIPHLRRPLARPENFPLEKRTENTRTLPGDFCRPLDVEAPPAGGWTWTWDTVVGRGSFWIFRRISKLGLIEADITRHFIEGFPDVNTFLRSKKCNKIMINYTQLMSDIWNR